MAFNARQLRLNEEQIRLNLSHIKLDPPPVELCLRQTKRDAQRIKLCLRQIDFILLWIRPCQEQIKRDAHRTQLVFLRILRLFRLLWRDWPQIAAVVMLAMTEQASAIAPPRSINVQIDGRAGLIAALHLFDRVVGLVGEAVHLQNGLGHLRQSLLPEAGDVVQSGVDVGESLLEHLHIELAGGGLLVDFRALLLQPPLGTRPAR